MILFKNTKDIEDLKRILELQKANLPENISEDEKRSQGFVTVHHSLTQLQQMASFEPQIVALDEGKVVGYVLCMVSDMRGEFPEIAPMFEMLPSIKMGEKFLSQYNYIVCGQACVDKRYRGKGLLKKLYENMKYGFSDKYDMCITEIATSNSKSMGAHNKIVFESVKTYNDGQEDWELVVWNWA
ncbi:MAG: GNAT family N-acetyltransferase [Pseudopedobacter saltans]|uniref:GNAT family N-acetyltransferase n=1 Tax=Pseudopedobacter saltans TaxID=151895 RepID=A0A2W5EIX7_9SPHI|nr:MAG: GNAT family N-acetyltransferase [Pseudopedobacter saltans]